MAWNLSFPSLSSESDHVMESFDFIRGLGHETDLSGKYHERHIAHFSYPVDSDTLISQGNGL